MDKKLNLVKILRNVPKGTKLYSTVHNEVTFNGIDEFDVNYPIMAMCSNGELGAFTSAGRFYAAYPDAECVLFPSKEERNWDNFKPCQFKDGELVWAKLFNAGLWNPLLHSGKIEKNLHVCYRSQTCKSDSHINAVECVKFDQRPF